MGKQQEARQTESLPCSSRTLAPVLALPELLDSASLFFSGSFSRCCFPSNEATGLSDL